ncbi:MAG: YceD family protein [Bacillota bacterium]
MKVSLRDFRGVQDIERQVEVKEDWPQLNWQGLPIEFPEGVTINAAFSSNDGLLQVTGTVSAVLRQSCSRCAEEFDRRVELPLQVQIPLRGDDPEEQWLASYLNADTDQLDLSELATQTILEQMPMQPLCDPRCQGLCPACGQNLNRGQCDCNQLSLDPRLAVLRSLLPDEPQR